MTVRLGYALGSAVFFGMSLATFLIVLLPKFTCDGGKWCDQNEYDWLIVPGVTALIWSAGYGIISYLLSQHNGKAGNSIL